MAATPPPKPPAENTGAVGPRGDDVDPAHIVKYLSPWKFGDPRNPSPENATDNFIEIHNQILPDGDEQFDHIHPFKLQFYTEDDETDGNVEEDDDGNVIENGDEQVTKEGDTKLRIYTGMLTATINTFTYSEDKDTDTTYEADLSVASYTGSVCGPLPNGEEKESVSTTTTKYIDNNPANGTMQEEENPLIAQDGGGHDAEVVDTTTGNAAGTGDSLSHTHSVTIPAHASHTHSIPDHYHDVPSHSHELAAHRHWAKGQGESDPELCELDLTAETEDIDHFLTIGGQPKIRGPLQIEPEGFSDVTIEVDGEDTPTGYRAQTLDPTYGKVWLVWNLITTGLSGAADNIVTGVEIVVQDEDPSKDLEAGALVVTGDDTEAKAERDDPKDGKYALHIGTAFDPDADDAEDNPVGGIEQVIYENVYYSPLILPEINYE